MTAFVKSVEYVEITLTGSTAVSANLTKSQTFGDCVPRYTVNLDSSVGDIVDDRYVDVYFEAGPKVTAKRSSTAGTVTVGIFVVEYDTAVVSVQQGTFSFSGTSTTEAISSVTTTKAFCTIAYENSYTSDRFAMGQVKVKFDSAIQLGFNRRGSGGTVNGHYYVVSTTGSEFSVQHVTMAPASNAETDTDTITSVTLAETFVYSTYDSGANDDDIRDGGWIVDLQNATTVRARRSFNSFGGSPGAASGGATIETQIVSAGASEFSVERNECDWADSLTKAVAITTIDQTKAIVIAGGYMGVMSCNEINGGELNGNYAILDFTSNSEVTGTRGVNTSPDGTTMFEVVEFVLAGVGGTTFFETLAATAIGVAALATTIITVLALAATTTGSAILVRVATFFRALGVTTTVVVALSKVATFFRALVASATGSAVLTRIATFFRALTVTAVGTAVLAKGLVKDVLLTASTLGTATLATVATFLRALPVTASATVGLTRLNTFFRALTPVATGLAVLVEVFISLQTLAATALGAPVLAKGFKFLRALPASTTALAVLTKSFIKPVALAAVALGAAVLARPATFFRSLVASASASPVLTKLATFLRALAASATGLAGVAKGLFLSLVATALGVAALVKGFKFLRVLTASTAGLAALAKTFIAGGAVIGSIIPLWRRRRR